MQFENPLFLILILCGVVFVIAGFVLRRFPPKSINLLYGYRTSNSMKSQERWDFAQQYSGQQLFYLGLSLMAVSCLGLIIDTSPTVGVVLGLGIMLLGVVLMIVRVEKAIKRRFDD